MAPSNIKFLLHWSFTELKRSISRSGKKAIYFYWRSLFSVKIVCLCQLILLITSIFIRFPLICGKSTWTILIHGKSTWNIFNCQLKKPETIGLDNILPLFGLSSFIGWIHLFQGIFQGILNKYFAVFLCFLGYEELRINIEILQGDPTRLSQMNVLSNHFKSGFHWFLGYF